MSIEDPNTGPGKDAGRSSDLQAQASDELNKATEKAKHDLDAVSKRAADDVRHLGEQANQKVGEAADKAKSFADDQKNLAAGQVNGVAAAITKVADELDGSDQQTVARYARDVASGLSKVGKTIEDRDVDDLMGMAQDFGRQQPVAFLGVAALAGFVASRFALASAHRRENKTSGSTYSGSERSSYTTGTTGTARSYTPGTTGGSSGYTPGGSSSSATTPGGYSSSAASYRPGEPGQNSKGGL